MTKVLPLGELLIEAGLISTGQLQTALYDQQSYKEMRLGEIIASRGWLCQETVDFFADFLQNASLKQIRIRLGECLVEAALINPNQIENILDEQKVNHVRFGSIAVLKGYISQKTLDFFLRYFAAAKGVNNTCWQGNRQNAKNTISQHNKETLIQKQTQPQAIATLAKDLDSRSAISGMDSLDIHWI